MAHPLNSLSICFIVSGTLFPHLEKIARPFEEVRVNFLPSLVGDYDLEGVGGDCSRGFSRFSRVSEQLRKEGEDNAFLFVFLRILHGYVQQEERLVRKQLLSNAALSYPVVSDCKQSQICLARATLGPTVLSETKSVVFLTGALDLTKQALPHHVPQGDDEVSQVGLGPPI